MADYKVISSDSHVVEPPDIWVERMDRAKFGNRIPHMVPAGDIDAWMVDNKETGGVGSIAQAGFRFDRPDEIVLKGSFDDVRPGGYIPSEHVKDMDIDGVHGGLVYPSIGLALYRDVEDPDLARGIFAAYNDWLAEFCNAYPDRLKGAAMILVDEDVDLAIEETQRVADLGIKTVMISSYPRADRTYDNPIYEPYWTMAEENDITVNLHVTTNRPKADPITRGVSTTSTASYVQHDYWVRMSLCHMIFSGVFERHPNLKVAEVEHELGLAALLHRAHRHCVRGEAGVAGDAVQGRDDAQRFHAQERVPQLPGGRAGDSDAARHWCGEPDVGIGLPALGVDVPEVAGDFGQHT